jgi:hypothetical protein
VNETTTVVLPWSYVALLAWRDVQAWLTRVDWMLVFGGILIGGTVLIIWRMSRSRSGRFDIADAFAGENGKTSMSKLLTFAGGLAAIWVVVALTVREHMTEGYFGLFLAAVVLQKTATEAVGVFRQAQIARTVEAGGNAPPSSADPQPDRISDQAPSNPPRAVRSADTGGRRPRGKHE